MSAKSFEIGGFAVYQWGYGQTNVDFFQVVRKSDKSIWLQPVRQVFVKSGYDSLSEYVAPVPEKLERDEYVQTDTGWERQSVVAKILRKKLIVWPSENGVDELASGDHGLIYPYDNKPILQTHYH